MDLSPDLFNEIVAATAATAAAATERPAADRRSARVRTGRPLVVCGWDDPTAVLTLRVRDLSAGGVGLLHRRRLALDERLVVRLPRADGDSVPVLGRVVYWEPLAPELYAIGLGFDRVVSEEELQARADDGAVTSTESAGMVGRVTAALAWTWRRAS
jgi:hypothetical protein